jgi:hypothetical protein
VTEYNHRLQQLSTGSLTPLVDLESADVITSSLLQKFVLLISVPQISSSPTKVGLA